MMLMLMLMMMLMWMCVMYVVRMSRVGVEVYLEGLGVEGLVEVW